MSLNPIKTLNKISVKITLIYSLILLTSLIISFFAIYSFFEMYLDNKTKEELLEKAKSYKILFTQEKISGLKKQILKESEVINNVEQFYKIYDEKGNNILNTNTSVHTYNIVFDLKNYMKLKTDNYLITTIDQFYIIAYKLSPKYTLVIGKSKINNNKLLNRLLEIFYYWGFAVFIISFLGGIIIANSITRKIKKITNTAKELSTSMNLQRRIEVKDSGDEIDELGTIINNLLDRIENLIRTLKETTESVAHDLKTPIARIKAASENMLMKNKLSKECTDLLVYIIEETNSLNQMIGDLLTISKLESGVIEIQKSKINLSKIVKNLYILFKDYAISKNVSIEINVPDEVYILGNENYLTRAIANLIDNAIKFNKENGKVLISIYEEEDSIKFSIKDTGIGIPQDKVSKIFEKFYRVDESRGIHLGSGLGLSLVKAILDQHNATINVISTENKGTEFIVTFKKITNN